MSEYKRLTEKSIGSFQYCLKNHKPKVGEFNDYDAFFDYSMAIKRLGEIEDKIMNGTLVETPCKVGDTVYCVEYFCNYKGCSSDEQMFCCGCPEMIERERRKEKFVISKKKFRLQDLDRVGKTLFPTEEAAEARLKELQEEQK